MTASTKRDFWGLCACGVLFGYALCATFSDRPAAASSSPNGDPFVALQTQINDLQAQLEDCQVTIDDQQNLIDVLSARMVFDGDNEWVGWREMTLAGRTRFTDADDIVRVDVHGATGAVVKVYSPADMLGLNVEGSARIIGPSDGDALSVGGRSRFESYEPTNPYIPAVEVVGPAWFRPSPSLDPTVLLNGAGSPAYVGWFNGPSVFSDADENRWLSLFQHPSRPIMLERFVDTPFMERPFFVELFHGAHEATVHAASFVED